VREPCRLLIGFLLFSLVLNMIVVGVPAQQQAYSADPVFSPIRDLSRSFSANETEAQIAVCGDNVYVVWLSRSFDSVSYYNRSIFFARSTNNGISFSSPIKIGHTNEAQVVPIVASGSNVYVAWLDAVDPTSLGTQIFFARSSDNGASFGSPVELKNGATYSEDPQIAASGSNVYVTWIDSEYSPSTRVEILFRASTDNGTIFGSPISVCESTNGLGGCQIAASGNNVYLAWDEYVEEFYKLDIFLRVSKDSGSSFGSLINLSKNDYFVSSLYPRIAISGSNVYVAWITWVHNRLWLFQGSYIHFARSTDYGVSFSDKISLYYESWPPFYNLEMVVSGTNIYAAWNIGVDWILFTRSNDEGASFSSPIAFWSPAVYEDTRLKMRIDFSIPKIAASGNNVYLAWTAHCELIDEEERVIGEIDDTFFTASTDGGISFTDPTDISNSGESYLPRIAASGSNVILLWQDNSLGDEEIFYRVFCEGVTFPDYRMSAIPPSLFVPPSRTNTSTITIQSIEGFNDAVDLKTRWLPPVPSNVISQLAPNQVTPPSGGSTSTTLTVTASASASGGTFTLKISGVSRTDGIVNHLKVSIDVPGYRIRAYSIWISSLQTVETPISIQPLDGFNDTVYLTTSWVGTPPSGVIIQLVPEQATPPYAPCTLTVRASPSPSYGTFTLRITGVSSPLGITHYVDVQILVQDFTLSASPSSLSMDPSQTANSTITIQSLGGFDWYVYLDASWIDGPPSGVSFDLTDWMVYPPPDGSVSSTLMVTTSASPSAGTFTLRITGAFSDTARYVDVQIQVTGKPDYAISASPSSLTVDPSGTVTSTITVQSINNFKERVDLTWSWAPSPNGVTVQFEPSQVTPQPGGSVTSTLTVSTSASPSPGTFILRITGASLGITHSVDVSITVSSPAGRGTTSCVCTETGPFVDPEVTDMVPADPQGYSPDKSSQVTVSTIGDTPYLTLTRKDGEVIVREVSNPVEWGFGPDNKTFVLVTKPPGFPFTLSLYNITRNKKVIADVTNPLSWGFSPNSKYFVLTTHPYGWQLNQFLLSVYDIDKEKPTIPGITVTYSTAGGDIFTSMDPEETEEGTVDDVGWGFSPDGRTFLLAYRTSTTTYPAAYHLSLYNTPTGYSILSQDRTDVAAFWQFSPCSDILMFVTQAGTQPSTTDPVYFYYTSRPNTLYTPTPPGQIFLRSPWTPSATVVKDGTTYKIQLTSMSAPSIPSPQCTTSVTANSPVNIVVTCPKGLRTGFDPTTGGEINEIPGATYTGVGSEPQTITLPYLDGTFKIEAYGLNSLTSLQEYSLTIETTDGSGETVTTATLSSVASAGSYQRFSFNLDEEGTITSATPETPPPQPPLLQPQVWSTNSLGNPQSTFLPQETVYVNGSNFPTNQPVTIYIIPDTEDPLPSNAVAIASATTDALGTLPITPVWSPPLMLGEYDIWVDVNQNGIYDTGDIRNDQAIGIYSFNVIPEVPFGTAMTLLSMLITLGFLRLKRVRPKFRRNKKL